MDAGWDAGLTPYNEKSNDGMAGPEMSFPLKEKYINLLTDFGFKRVFGTEPNQHSAPID